MDTPSIIARKRARFAERLQAGFFLALLLSLFFIFAAVEADTMEIIQAARANGAHVSLPLH